jgi:subtilisin family serine protease
MNTRRVFLTAAAALTCVAAAIAGSGNKSADFAAARERFRQDLAADPNMEYDPHSLLVRFSDAANPADRQMVLDLIDGVSIRRYTIVPGLEQVELPGDVDDAIALLNTLQGKAVMYAEPDYIVRAIVDPNDPYYGNLYGMDKIDAPQAWDIYTGDRDFVVAVIDTGVQYNHPDLAGNEYINPNESYDGIDNDGNGYVDDVRGWDFYQNDNDPNDQNGHGTHCAGTIGAVGNNNVGVVGVCWSLSIMPAQFLSPGGSGSISDALEALQYVTMMNVKISSNSWGGGGYSQSFYDAIEASKSVGHLFIAAAGNNGSNNDSSPFYPASYDNDNLISVAASDQNDNKAGFSNYGKTKVDLAAPGVDVYSTYKGSSYASLSGTSMATPHTSGAAALLYAYNPDWTYAQIRDRLLISVRKLDHWTNYVAAGGILNIHRALASGDPPSISIDAPANNSTHDLGASITFSGTAIDPETGDISNRIEWTSSRNGAIGTGKNVSTSSLSLGTHTITATVEDDESFVSTANIGITLVDPRLPKAPSNLAVQNLGGGKAKSTWTDNSNNETGFHLQRQKKYWGGWTSNTNINLGANVTSYTDSPGVGTFRYRVRARNNFGYSGWTDWVSVNVTN